PRFRPLSMQQAAAVMPARRNHHQPLWSRRRENAIESPLMNIRAILPLLLFFGLAAPIGALVPSAVAQDKGTLHPKPLPPLANPDDPALAAKQLFGRKTLPAAGAPYVIGFYARGCIAGAEALPVTGPTWQVMRLSRNRNWAHPAMV